MSGSALSFFASTQRVEAMLPGWPLTSGWSLVILDGRFGNPSLNTLDGAEAYKWQQVDDLNYLPLSQQR